MSSDKYKLCEQCATNIPDNERWCENCKSFAGEQRQIEYELRRAGNCIHYGCVYKEWLCTHYNNYGKPCPPDWQSCPLTKCCEDTSSKEEE